MPKKIILLYGFGGHLQKNWFPWLVQQCEALNIQLIIPELPNTAEPELERQLTFLMENYGETLDSDTVIIGHSLGTFLSKHFILASGQKISGLIDIAPVDEFTDFEASGKISAHIQKSLTTLQKYQNHKYDRKKLSKLIGKHTIFLSQTDHVSQFERAKDFFLMNFPSAYQYVFGDKGHFSAKNGGITQLPELLPFITGGVQTPTKLNPEKSDEGR